VSFDVNNMRTENGCRKAEDPGAQLKIEAEMAARVAAKAKERVEVAMQR